MVNYAADCIIVGGGISGMVTALELLDSNLKIILFDRDSPQHFGGLAKESFGGIFFVDSPTQKRSGIHDSIERAMQDWYSFAEFEQDAVLPRKWADAYISHSTSDVYAWLRKVGIRFFPVLHWIERGWKQNGNSVPRFHMVWGTGHELILKLTSRLRSHPNAQNLTIHFNCRVEKLQMADGRVTGVTGINEKSGIDFEAHASHTVIASGGIGGNIELVKEVWGPTVGGAPEKILNGSHRFALGDMHKEVQQHRGKVTNLEKMWHYAAGIHHPQPNKPDHGVSLVPPKSALWLNYRGQRIGPDPLVSGFDTSYLVNAVCAEDVKYSWQVMNMRIAVKEFAISGAEFNSAIRKKNFLGFLRNLYFGNPKLVKSFIRESKDFVVADTVEQLVVKMNDLTGDAHVRLKYLKDAIEQYDAQVELGEQHFTDRQLTRIRELRQYRGDRIRTCKYQKINDKNALPFVAIREFILSRKSLGGIQTDLRSRVVAGNGQNENEVIRGLYAVGEAAGFGGGGIHGRRALEGTFLGTCIFTAQKAAQSIKSEIS